jgi:hypothetical protein
VNTEIFEDLVSRGFSQRQIAQELNMARSTVSYFLNKLSLRTTHLPTQGRASILHTCLQCGKNTTNPKFCNNSCSAKYNNPKKPKKRYEITCKYCSIIFECPRRKNDRTVCDKCYTARAFRPDTFGPRTLKRVKEDWTTRVRPWTDAVRRDARKRHPATGKTCNKCGYTLHVEVCHIRAIVDFPDTATVSEVNSNANIIHLCPNCHWEFDNL